MIRFRLLACALAGLAIAGCTAHRLKGFDDRLGDLNHQCAGPDRQPADVAACAQRYEQLATESLGEARKATADPLMGVAFYRVAAVAAFEAGAQGAQTVTESSDEGTRVCDHLPEKDASAPRDCALIRLAYPLAVSADLSRRLGALVDKRDALRRADPAAQLPASDLAALLSVYDGFETQLGKVSALRADLGGPAVPEHLEVQVDEQRRAIYCWALKAYSVAFDVEGTTPAGLAELTARKTALRQRTEQSLGVIDCRTSAPIAVPHE